MEERLYWLSWQWILPGSSKHIHAIAEHFGSLREAWTANESELSGVPDLGTERIAGIVRRKADVDPELLAEKLKKLNIDYLCLKDPGYPSHLQNIFDPPAALFVRGDLSRMNELAVAVVGARKPSSYGQIVAEKLAKDLAAVGIAVISGMARGIDTSAHKGALAAGGKTAAVLGCGLDVVYPRENKKLMERIAESGAVISEFPPGSQPEAWHFPVRNRVISGLSLGTVVVEASEKSGALITANFALEQGRDVMAVPGNVTSPLSRGPHRLLKQGARLVEGAGDIIDELGLERLFPLPENDEEPALKISEEEKILYRLLTLEPVSMENIISRSGLTPQKVMAALMYMELKGLTKQLPGKFYIRTGPVK